MAQSGPTGRAGEPAEIAPAIVFLASDEPSFVKGSTVQADGGPHAV
jgi:NAD(P)-dependent dehydrogenase (short-subunit alcohol dehydrogenase family)